MSNNSLLHSCYNLPMIVISDMMGTLTTGSPILGLLDWIKVHQSQVQARWLMASMMPSYLLVKLGLIDPQPWGQGLMIKSLNWLKEMDEEHFAEAAEWAVEHNLWPKKRGSCDSQAERTCPAGCAGIHCQQCG